MFVTIALISSGLMISHMNLGGLVTVDVGIPAKNAKNVFKNTWLNVIIVMERARFLVLGFPIVATDGIPQH